MRRKVSDVLEKARMNRDEADGLTKGTLMGRFIVAPEPGVKLVVVSNGGDVEMWRMVFGDEPMFEHVSVSVMPEEHTLRRRTPRWSEMCFVKGLFWDEEETVIQYHPPKSCYVNWNPHVLHLWKPAGLVMPLPPVKAIAPSLGQGADVAAGKDSPPS